MLTIKNLTKSPITFNLALPEHRERKVLNRYSYDARTGHRYTKRVKLSLGTSITLLAGEMCSNLPDAIEQEVEVQNAVKAKKIKIVKIAESDQPSSVEQTDSTPRVNPQPEPTTETRGRRRIAPTTDKE